MGIAKDAPGKSTGASGGPVTGPVANKRRGVRAARHAAARSISSEALQSAHIIASLSSRFEAARAAQLEADRAAEYVIKLAAELPSIFTGRGATADDESALSAALDDAQSAVRDAAAKALVLYARAPEFDAEEEVELKEIVANLQDSIRKVDFGASLLCGIKFTHQTRTLVKPAPRADVEAAQKAEFETAQAPDVEATPAAEHKEAPVSTAATQTGSK